MLSSTIEIALSIGTKDKQSTTATRLTGKDYYYYEQPEQVNFLESQFLWSWVELRLRLSDTSCQARVSKFLVETVKLREFLVCAAE